jgi:hypothetical protein
MGCGETMQRSRSAFCDGPYFFLDIGILLDHIEVYFWTYLDRREVIRYAGYALHHG